MEDYTSAIEDYTHLLKMRPQSASYNFEIGLAYLRSPKDFEKAEGFFENALKYSEGDTIEELFYYLGKAYQENHKFAEAKGAYKNFERFIRPSKEGAELKAQVQWLEKTCNHGEYHVKLNTKNPLENKTKPVNDIKKYFLNATDFVVIQNLGSRINSIHDDEGAVFFNKENDIIFTSKRNPFTNPNEFTHGKFFEQIFVSKLENDEWALPSVISSLHLFEDNFDVPSAQVSIVSTTKDEKNMILYKNENLYITTKTDGKWSNPAPLPENININKSRQPSAFLSESGKTLVLVSAKSGGYGGTDMYTCKLNEDGTWGEPENMGSVINTEQDEDTPFLVGDDLLYFSSKGHSSIGGFDIFFSQFKNGKWGNPQSLGIPINTPKDEIAYIRSYEDPTVAFYASSRADGYGYKDVYRIEAKYQTKKRDDLPSVAMADFLSDELKKKEAEEAKKQEAVAVVVPPPVKDEPKEAIEPVKEEPKVVPVVVAKKPVDEDLFRDILFSFNGNELTPESQVQLRKIAEYMQANPDFVISLSGHADHLGSEEVNDEVSRQRALIVTTKLADAGVDAYHINYSYFGETKPKAKETNADGSDNPENRAKNRRVEFDLGQLAMFRVIGFAPNSSSIASTDTKTLQEVADFLKNNPGKKVELNGFADSVGNADVNRRLSEKRVNNTSAELQKLGVNKSSIDTNFFGEERPSAPGTNSRRVEIKIN